MKGEPKTYREAGISYCVPPFTAEEGLHIAARRMVPIRYSWKNIPSNRTGYHTVYVFQHEAERFQDLLDHWGRGKDWEYGI